MNRRTLLWLSAIAALALVVAYQTLGSSAGRHADEFAARAGVPTVQPGADVLAGIAVLPKRIHRYDYRRSAFGHPGTIAMTRREGTTGATPATTSSTGIWSTRHMCRSSGVRMRWPPAPCAIRTPTPPLPSNAAPVLANRSRSTTSFRSRMPGTWAPIGGRTPSECASPTIRPTCWPCRAGKSGQGRFATGPMDATQQGLRLSVRDAIHRRAARLFTASGSAIVRRTASGRGHLPDRLVTRRR